MNSVLKQDTPIEGRIQETEGRKGEEEGKEEEEDARSQGTEIRRQEEGKGESARMREDETIGSENRKFHAFTVLVLSFPSFQILLIPDRL